MAEVRLRAPLIPKKFFHTTGELTNIQREEMKAGVFGVSKSMDTPCPRGQWIVTPDEVGDPHDPAMDLRVNGAVRQRSHSERMAGTIPEIISHSSSMGYNAGDIISPGTASGVAGLSEDGGTAVCQAGRCRRG